MESRLTRNSTSCEDCGNKAKKDCNHKRCRTCCKSRGFNCPTHVKSTWVSVSHRRRLSHHHHHNDNRFLSLPLSLSSTHLPISPNSSVSLSGQGVNFPAEVNSTANFRCIRVHSDNNTLDHQYAYQTSINIGGHLFKGVLYNQAGGGNNLPDQSHQLRLQQFDISTTATTTTPPSSGSNLLNYPSLYNSPSFNAFFPSMQFFSHPKP